MILHPEKRLSVHRLAALGFLSLGLLLPGVTSAAGKADSAASTITVIFKQLNVPVEANFTKFNTRIAYDAAKPNLSKASVEIDVTSFDLGDPDYNSEVLKKEWFDAAQFPKASFVSNSIVATAPGKLTVSGTLTMKGKSALVRFPLSVQQQAGNQIFDGVLPIKRSQFNIGDGEWKDTSLVADEVIIKFHVLALPASLANK